MMIAHDKVFKLFGFIIIILPLYPRSGSRVTRSMPRGICGVYRPVGILTERQKIFLICIAQLNIGSIVIRFIGFIVTWSVYGFGTGVKVISQVRAEE